jgi:cholesterol transport system auxiliary component
MTRAIVLMAAVLVAACAPFGSREAESYFILDAPTASGTATRAAMPAVVVVPTTASSFYDTQDIAYSRSAGTRAYYQFSHWTERPQRAVHAQLLSRLGTQAQSSRRSSEIIIVTHLEEIYHDAAQQPGTVHIAMTAQLVDPTSRVVLASRRFSSSAPAASYDASGAVAGMREALGALLDEAMAWLASQTPAGAARN